MSKELRIGDKVRVMDQGLLMLQRFAPPGSNPNNVGFVKEFLENGDILIEFQIGDEPIENHSQVAPYPTNIIKRITP
jgi:hypothetical protein